MEPYPNGATRESPRSALLKIYKISMGISSDEKAPVINQSALSPKEGSVHDYQIRNGDIVVSDLVPRKGRNPLLQLEDELIKRD